MDVLVAIDVIGGRPHALLEPVELANDLGLNFRTVEQPEQGACEEALQSGKGAIGRQPRHGPERGSDR